MATIRDVAREAGVSIATVSATLNGTKKVSDKLQVRVRDAVDKVGYAPNALAQSLKRGATRNIGLVIPDITNAFFAKLARAVETAASDRGYTVLLCNTDEDPEKERAYLRLLRTQRVVGVILAPAGSGAEYGAELSREVEGPGVFIDRLAEGPDWDSVVVDNVTGVRDAMNHLIALGHRHIAAVFGRAQVSTTLERMEGYRQALAAAGIEPDPSLIRVRCSGHDRSYRATQAVLDRPDRPTALFTSNNSVTLGAMHALRDMGLACPDDISVIGVDGLEWANAISPGLTTIEQPAADMGARAVSMLLERLENAGSAVSQTRLPVDLILRKSCAAPKR